MRGDRNLFRAALERLDVRRFAFGIHQSAFPAGEGDVGTGVPNSRAGRAFTEFVASFGFDALQLGPYGQTSEANPSPYDGTVFARSLTAVDLARLTEAEDGALLSDDDLRRLTEIPHPFDTGPERSHLARALRASREALTRAQARLAQQRDRGEACQIARDLEAFRHAQATWLERDALFEAMARRLGHDDPARFDPAVRALFSQGSDGAERRRSLRAVLRADLEQAELGQLLSERHARAYRRHAHACGMQLFGDFQIGWSHRERFLHPEAFSPRFLLGAPPSRTNPEGQPWGYPLLDPDQLDDPQSPARRLLKRRLERAFAFYDGMRIDHPHGLVCPWVYAADDEQALRAVQQGTRAFESPDLVDPDLTRWAIARLEDLDRSLPRYADGWVRRTRPGQVESWSRLMDEVMAAAAEHGAGAEAIAAEVLSTCPTPLRRVLARHHLGRFRVTQKMNVERPDDVYRTDQVAAADWVMLGNHDTPTLWQLAQRWLDDGSAQARAHYLAERLVPEPGQRAAAAHRYCQSPGALVQASLADLLACDAQNVSIYFTDFFGVQEPFNRPGTLHPDNWTLRVSPDYEARYADRCAGAQAIDVADALAQALRAHGAAPDLVAALQARSSART